MSLTNPTIESLFQKYPLLSQIEKGKEAIVLAKYYDPYGRSTWIITEAEKLSNGDWKLYGYCYKYKWEWKHFLLSELKNIKYNNRTRVKRSADINEDIKVKECIW